MVSALAFRIRGHGFKSRWGWNSAHDCTALHCSELFIIILPLSQYDLNNVKLDKDVNYQKPSVAYALLYHIFPKY